MEGAGTIMSAGVVQSVSQAPAIEAPRMEEIQHAPHVPEVAEQFGVPKPEAVEGRNRAAQGILDVAKDEGYDAAFEEMARGDFGEKAQEEFAEERIEGQLEEIAPETEHVEHIEDRVQILEGQVSHIMQLQDASLRMVEIMKLELQGLTLEELLALALILKKKLEKEEEDKGIIDALISIIGKLFQAMVEPEVITGEKPAEEKAA